MSHPPRYDDDDPLLARLRELALGFPGAQEKISHGTPTFYTVKVFAQFGAHVKGEHDSRRLRRSVVFKPEPGEREALLTESQVHVPAYSGPSGWLALDLMGDTPDWDEVAELLDGSYRQTAPVRLIQELDKLGGPARDQGPGN